MLIFSHIFHIHFTPSRFTEQAACSKHCRMAYPGPLHGPINMWNCFRLMAYTDRTGLGERDRELCCKEMMNTQLSMPIHHSMHSCRRQEKNSSITEVKFKLPLICEVCAQTSQNLNKAVDVSSALHYGKRKDILLYT